MRAVVGAGTIRQRCKHLDDPGVQGRQRERLVDDAEARIQQVRAEIGVLVVAVHQVACAVVGTFQTSSISFVLPPDHAQVVSPNSGRSWRVRLAR